MKIFKKVGISVLAFGIFCAVLYMTMKKENAVFEKSKQIYHENIVEEELEKNYKFLFLTDSHLVVKSGEEEQAVQDYASTLETAMVDQDGVKSVDVFPQWIEYANNQEVDGVLLGGDILSYPTEQGLSYLSEELAELDSPYVYAIGNHDWTFPWEYFTEKSRKEYKPKFSEFSSVIEYEDLIVLSIDNSTDQVDPNSLEQFKEYYELDKPMILVMHVPFSTETVEKKSIEDWGRNIAIGGSGIYPDENTRTLISMVYAEESPVVCVLDGHIHAYDRSALPNGTVQLVGDDAFSGSGLMLTLTPEEGAPVNR